jgi:uncharacterized damage-inducible protein DinB
MNTKYYIERLEDIYNGKPWLGISIAAILKEELKVNPNFKVINGNSLANLLEHILNWRLFTIEKLKENIDFDIELNTQQDWNTNHNYSLDDYNELIKEINQSHLRIIKLLKLKQDDKWLKKTVSGKNYNYQYLMDGIIEHDLYHFGQFTLLLGIAKRSN